MEKKDFFDGCDQNSWCQCAIDYILRELGYTTSWLEHVYCLEPGYGLSDGLRNMDYEKDSKKMAAASVYNKSMRLYVDHVDFLRSHQVPDDVCVATISELPKVIVSPTKKNLRRTTAVGTEEEEAASDEGVKQADSEINDSDCEFSDGRERI